MKKCKFKIGDLVVRKKGRATSLSDQVCYQIIDIKYVNSQWWLKFFGEQHLWGGFYEDCFEPFLNVPVKASELPTEGMSLKQVLERYEMLRKKGLIIRENG